MRSSATSSATITTTVTTSKTQTKSGAFNLRNILILVSILAGAKVILGLVVYLTPPTQVTEFPAFYPAMNGLSSFIHTLTDAWDGTNYILIAEFGYPSYSTFYFSKLYAFSPVYPALIYATNYLFSSFFTSSFVLTNGLSFFFPIILLKLFDFRTALIAELFSTYLVFTMVAYSDILALIFLGLAFICFFRGRYVLTGLALSAAAFVFFNLFLAVIPFLLYMVVFKRERTLRHYLGLVLPPIIGGLLVLLAYQIATGNPFAFFWLEKYFWGVKTTNPIGQIEWLLNNYEPGSFEGTYWVIFGVQITSTYWIVRNLLFEAFLFAGIFLLTRLVDPRKWLYIIYSATLSVPLLFVEGTVVYSIPRLMLAAFPIFAGYSNLLRRNWQVCLYAVISIAVASWAIVNFVYAFFA